MSGLADLEKRIRAMEDIHAIEQLRHNYWYTLDHKLWAEFEECFTEDMVFEYVGKTRWEGRATFMKFIKERYVPQVINVHQGHNPFIELTSDTTAWGRWPLNSILIDIGTTDKSESTGYGYYEDEYVKQLGKWKIRAMKLTYLLNFDHTTRPGMTK